ncbi:MAG: oxygenase MpaB family protein, partial [Dokdonella sp.]|uniref:oxygenase MpaB family protein n=1 Tax=Dokdonella sp. TaxID=2291710 RepID=UPI003267B517
RADLTFDARSREVLTVLSRIRLPVPAAGLSRNLFLGAGAALLPEWARSMLGHGPLQRAQSVVSASVLRSMAPLFRVALPDGIAPRACRRMNISPAILSSWSERSAGCSAASP